MSSPKASGTHPLRISVVVPVYNGQETLERCLTALAKQTGWTCGVDYELIVIDDGSTDDTARIAENFPVRLFRLHGNQGRIVARETGAQQALSDDLLFVDSRVIVASNFLEQQALIEGPVLMAGNFGEEERARNSRIDRVFLLLRNRFYANGYPQKEEFLFIQASNFNRSPKGLGCTRIKKNLFLSCQPADKSKVVNDDARLLYTIVKEHNVPIKRCLALRAEYLQRSDARAVGPWMAHRGVMFVDFVLARSAAFKLVFFGALAYSLVAVSSLIWAPRLAIYLVAAVFAAFLFACLWLSRSPRDFAFLLRTLPTLGFHFAVGVSKGGLSRLLKTTCPIRNN